MLRVLARLAGDSEAFCATRFLLIGEPVNSSTGNFLLELEVTTFLVTDRPRLRLSFFQVSRTFLSLSLKGTPGLTVMYEGKLAAEAASFFLVVFVDMMDLPLTCQCQL